MVLMSVGGNDAHRVKISDKDYLDYIKRTYWGHPNMFKSRLVQLGFALSNIILVTTKKDDALKPRVNLHEYEENLKEMISLARSKNIKIIFLTRPFIGSSFYPLWWKNFAPDYNSLTKQIADESNSGLIDLYAEFKDKEIYFHDESHFNDSGFNLAANIIHAYLMNIDKKTGK